MLQTDLEFSRDGIREREKKQREREREEERRDKILWGLVFTHELHPSAGDEGGNIDPGVTHTRLHTYVYCIYTYTSEHESAFALALLRGRERSV